MKEGERSWKKEKAEKEAAAKMREPRQWRKGSRDGRKENLP